MTGAKRGPGRLPLPPGEKLDAVVEVKVRSGDRDRYRALGIDMSATARAAWEREARRRERQ